MKTQFELTIQGMTCDSCAIHVTEALRSVPGVETVEVPGWQSGRARVIAAADLDPTALEAAVSRAGYQAQRRPQPAGGHEISAEWDLIVIGSGGGGMAAAIRAAELGYRAAIIEAGTIGGTCVNIGCVPSKTLIRAAQALYHAAHHPFRGVHTRVEGLDWPAVLQQKDELVARLRQEKYLDVLAAYGDRITLIRGRARLTPEGQVAVNGDVLKGKRIVIATGARPRILPLPGIEEVEVLTSTSLMALPRLPRSLLVLGGRSVALELGQTFARFGVQVTILQRSPRILPAHEPEIADALTAALRAEGLTIHTGVTLQRIREQDGEKVVTAEIGGVRREFRAEQVLMAVGRTPNTQDMGLEEAGVALDEGGFIQVDEHLRTTHPHIYAVGDVTTLPKFVYVAAAAGSIAAENALTDAARTLDLSAMPAVTFTDPAVATVGLTEAQAREQGYAVKVSELPMAYVPRALAAHDTRGLVKLVADADTDRLLGAHILAPEAGEMIQVAVLAIRSGLTVAALRETLFPYLTNVEAIKLAALSFEKDVAQLSCCAG